jgi:hypothetical protein
VRHRWGGAATYFLSEFVAGLQAAEGPAGFGFQEWVVNPGFGVQWGLEWTRAHVLTSTGGKLSVEWKIMDRQVEITFTAPQETKGTLKFKSEVFPLTGQTSYTYKFSL